MVKERIGVIIQARVGSTRLPSKMILPFYEGKSVLELLLLRLRERFALKKEVAVLVATTNNSSDDAIVFLSEKVGIPVFRGSEHDVLQRFIDGAAYIKTDRLIRVCADNPFLDMNALEILVEHINVKENDYIAFSTSEGTPTIKTHYGFWAEAVGVGALKKVAKMTDDKVYHEHVTNYIYTHVECFDIDFIPIPREIEMNKKIRLTLDTYADFEMQQEIYAKCMERFGEIGMRSVLSTLDLFPQFYEQMQEQIRLNVK